MKPIVTEDDKKLVKHLSKKSKIKKPIHIYYNRKNKDGKSNYLYGEYYSRKNKKNVVYRSSYELKFFHALEENPAVVSYEVENIKIPYIDVDGKRKKYIPDVIVLYKSGAIDVCEVKPKAMLEDETVKRKATACKDYFQSLAVHSKVDCKYKFITEDDLFSNSTEYTLFVNKHK